MADPVKDRLYELLPAIYRIRDTESGEQPLRALFSILEQELYKLESDIEGLYDNWFIETCDEWAVHYIGDLLKVPGLHSGGVGTFSLRSYVANILAYRRRKGTASVLEQMAHDVSGWPARVVEFHKLVSTTQNINHIRMNNMRTPDLRDTNALELLDGPFDKIAHLAEVRRVRSRRGKYNVPNIGIFLWRLQSYVMSRVDAKPLGNDNKRFIFDPLGGKCSKPKSDEPADPLDCIYPLFNRPQTETEITHIAEEFNVPGPLRRRSLYEELEARRESLLNEESLSPVYFGKQPVFQLFRDQQLIKPEAMMICDLSDWNNLKTVTNDSIQVLVDPELGRFAFPDGIPPQQVEVDYVYAFSGDVGGGPYRRKETLIGLFEEEDNDVWWASVSNEHDSGSESGLYISLAEAIDAWNSRIEDQDPVTGVIAILDNHTYSEALNTIIIRPGEQLLIIAAEWRANTIPKPGEWNRDLTYFLVADGLRPHLAGNISVRGESTQGEGRLLLNGLLVEGNITINKGDLGELSLNHCTLVPDNGGITVEDDGNIENQNSNLSIVIDHSICGQIHVPQRTKLLSVFDSILDASSEPGEFVNVIADTSGQGYGPTTLLKRCTIFDQVKVREITLASEVIFMGQVDTERLQEGCVRYSYVTPGSLVPRRFRCQPDLALVQRARELGIKGPEDLDPVERERIALQVRPTFTSVAYGQSVYAQLGISCPEEIRIGAEDGSEMGAFSYLKQPQREANINTNLNEYLRFGMDAGIFYVN